MHKAHLNIVEMNASEQNVSIAKRTFAFLHGIFGAGRNWATIAKSVVNEVQGVSARLVDLPGHGRSDHFPGPHGVGDIAKQIGSYLSETEILLGHSFGGKIALSLIPHLSQVKQVWIIDSTPAAKAPSGEAWAMLERLDHLPDRFASRDEAVEDLQREGLSLGVAQWMCMNLTRDGDGFTWRFKLDDIRTMMMSFFETDYWDILEAENLAAEVHFVKATKSDVMTMEVAARLQSLAGNQPRIHFHELEGGHWLHVDNPVGLTELIVQYIKSDRP